MTRLPACGRPKAAKRCGCLFAALDYTTYSLLLGTRPVREGSIFWVRRDVDSCDRWRVARWCCRWKTFWRCHGLAAGKRCWARRGRIQLQMRSKVQTKMQFPVLRRKVLLRWDFSL